MTDGLKTFKIVVLSIIGLAFLVVITIELIKPHHTSEEKKLKENVDKTVNYDSIISVSEKRLLDSIAGIRIELQKYKDDQHRENSILRKKNADLERRIKEIDTSNRPDF
jgi:predicted small secreted protein